jgi:hypothetical protein
MIEQSTIWVNLIKDAVSIGLMRSRKNNDFPPFFQLLEERNCIGPDINPNSKGVAIYSNVQLYICVVMLVLKTMD